MWPFNRKAKSRIRPLSGFVLVRLPRWKNRTDGGLLLPDTARARPTYGDVVALGKGRRLPGGEFASFTVRKGDRVLFGALAGTPIERNGVDYLLIDEAELLGIVD